MRKKAVLALGIMTGFVLVVSGPAAIDWLLSGMYGQDGLMPSERSG